MMSKHIKLQDVVEANNLLISMGAEDQLPRIASAAIERSLELQHRVDRAIRYAEEAHSSSLHVKQVLRILDGSITLDDEMNEVSPEPVMHGQALDEYPRLVRQALPEGEHSYTGFRKQAPAPSEEGGLGRRSTKQRKAFRDWLAEQGIDLPLNKTVPQAYIDAFDKATDGRHKPKPRTGPPRPGQGKLKPGHGLEGRSPEERIHIRTWLTEQGFDLNPTGRIPQKYINHYDVAMAELKRMQKEQRQQRQREHGDEHAQEQEQEQHAQGA